MKALFTLLGACVFACAPSVMNEVPHAATEPSAATSGAVPDAAPSGTAASNEGGYEYVARRGKATLAVAETRGPEPARAHKAMDRALDKFAQCLQGLAAEGKRLAPGAARVILRLSDSGDPESERVVAGEDSSYIVVRCLLPALKLQNYGAAKKSKDPRSLGIAFEALWEF